MLEDVIGFTKKGYWIVRKKGFRSKVMENVFEYILRDKLKISSDESHEGVTITIDPLGLSAYKAVAQLRCTCTKILKKDQLEQMENFVKIFGKDKVTEMTEKNEVKAKAKANEEESEDNTAKDFLNVLKYSEELPELIQAFEDHLLEFSTAKREDAYAIPIRTVMSKMTRGDITRFIFETIMFFFLNEYLKDQLEKKKRLENQKETSKKVEKKTEKKKK